MAISQDGGTQDKNEREQPHSGSHGAVAPGELKVQRHVVDRDKPRRVDSCRAAEKEDGIPVPHELHGEDASRHARKDGICLLNAKEDEERKGDNEERDDLPAAPVIQCADEIGGHDQGCDGSNAQDGAENIKFPHQGQGVSTLARLKRRNPQEINRGEQAGHAQVDVKRPSPRGRRLDEGAADDGSQHRADTPDQAHKAQIAWSLAVRGVDREQRHDAEVHAVAAHAGEHATNDEGVHVRCGSAQG